MSLAIVHSRAQVGVKAPAVTVEAHLANGLPALTLAGLPEGAVKEGKDRVRSAILNSGLDFPPRRITLNLATAYLPGMADGSILLLRWVCWSRMRSPGRLFMRSSSRDGADVSQIMVWPTGVLIGGQA